MYPSVVKVKQLVFNFIMDEQDEAQVAIYLDQNWIILDISYERSSSVEGSWNATNTIYTLGLPRQTGEKICK